MEPELAFRTDLYRGTASFYDRFRPPYPGALLEDLAGRLPVSGNGRLLDLACGTGQIALPLADRFTEVVAVDQEEEMVAYGRAKGRLRGSCEYPVGGRLGRYGGARGALRAGHNRERLPSPEASGRSGTGVFVAQAGRRNRLAVGDILARGDAAWQRAMGVLFEEWMAKLDATDRLAGGWEAAMDRHPHEQVLTQAGFDYVGGYEFITDQIWTVETLTGLVYSTSFLNLEALGDQADAFEADLSALLYSYESDGVFEVSAKYAYQLATKPTPT